MGPRPDDTVGVCTHSAAEGDISFVNWRGREEPSRGAAGSVLFSVISCGWRQCRPTPRVIEPSNTTPPEKLPPGSSPLAASSDTTASAAAVDAVSEETMVSDASPDVPEDPSDPDMLVLGFQELDLSAEALLYSTKTVREEAWCMAVSAGLGEKAVLYEKVSARRRS